MPAAQKPRREILRVGGHARMSRVAPQSRRRILLAHCSLTEEAGTPACSICVTHSATGSTAKGLRTHERRPHSSNRHSNLAAAEKNAEGEVSESRVPVQVELVWAYHVLGCEGHTAHRRKRLAAWNPGYSDGRPPLPSDTPNPRCRLRRADAERAGPATPRPLALHAVCA